MKKQGYESWVISFVENLSDYFNLAGWDVRVTFSEEESKDGSYAENEINSPYLFSTLTFYKQSRLDFEAGKMDHLITATVHEMVHIFIDPFQDWMHPHLSLTTTPLFMSSLENQVQKLTQVFIKTLPKKLIPPRPKNGKHHTTSADHKSGPTVPVQPPVNVLSLI
jgi:hypothetical protein